MGWPHQPAQTGSFREFIDSAVMSENPLQAYAASWANRFSCMPHSAALYTDLCHNNTGLTSAWDMKAARPCMQRMMASRLSTNTHIRIHPTVSVAHYKCHSSTTSQCHNITMDASLFCRALVRTNFFLPTKSTPHSTQACIHGSW